MKFRDASVIVPLLVHEAPSETLLEMLEHDS